MTMRTLHKCRLVSGGEKSELIGALQTFVSEFELIGRVGTMLKKIVPCRPTELTRLHLRPPEDMQRAISVPKFADLGGR